MPRPLRRASDWLYDRLGLRRLADFALRHPVPPENATGKWWMYVLGAAALAAFLLQVFTGVALATKYIPSPASAYDSLLYITRDLPFGGFLRAMHFVGASAMVVLVLAHLVRVFLTGSYQFPREMTWVLGVVLLALTLTIAFTGQLLRWDQNGFWSVSVAAHFIGRVPLVGEYLARFVLAGESVGGPTLSRFFVFHVIVLPVLILLTLGAHLYLVLHHGVSEPPGAGPGVPKDRYREWYDRRAEKGGRRYWPDAAWREAVGALLLVALVMGIAALVGPKGPGPPPDPTTVAADPRPDWYLRWYYALLWVKPRGTETFFMVYLPLLMLLALVAVPFASRWGERRPGRRPFAVAAVVLVLAVGGTLTELGLRAPWSMDFETQPLTARELGVQEGPVYEGARLFHERGCQYCHAVAGRGGTFGPDLTEVDKRLPPGVVVARTLNGTGEMPAYRSIVTRDELALILVFLAATGR